MGCVNSKDFQVDLIYKEILNQSVRQKDSSKGFLRHKVIGTGRKGTEIMCIHNSIGCGELYVRSSEKSLVRQDGWAT